MKIFEIITLTICLFFGTGQVQLVLQRFRLKRPLVVAKNVWKRRKSEPEQWSCEP